MARCGNRIVWKKVVAPIIFVVLLWLLASGATTYFIYWLYEAHARDLRENVSTIQAAGEIQDTLWRLQAVLMEAGDQADDATRKRAAELAAAFKEHLAEARQTSFTGQEQALVAAIGERFDAYYSRVQQRLLPSAAINREATPSLEKTVLLAVAVAEPCKQLLQANEQLLAASNARVTRLGTAVTVARLGFVIVGPLIGIGFGMWVARGLHRSVSEISVILRDAAGKLEHNVGRVALHPSGDLPDLQKQVEAVVGHISPLLDQLQQARQEATRSERLVAVGQLAAGVAHELRNPLTSVKLLVQNVAKPSSRHALSEQELRVLQEEIGRMENTIQGLLDFARPPQLCRVRHDVRQTVQRAVNLVEGRARQQSIVLEKTLSGVPVLVDGDPEQLHQVFINLLLNGIEAIGSCGRLSVAVAAADGSRGWCQVVFRDSGSGISTEVLSRMFEPFVTTKERGTGLGLAVSRRIIQQHGGELLAANCQGGGATFTVRLRLAGESARADSSAAVGEVANGSPKTFNREVGDA